MSKACRGDSSSAFLSGLKALEIWLRGTILLLFGHLSEHQRPTGHSEIWVGFLKGWMSFESMLSFCRYLYYIDILLVLLVNV